MEWAEWAVWVACREWEGKNSPTLTRPKLMSTDPSMGGDMDIQKVKSLSPKIVMVLSDVSRS